jgi:hypothetical protein
VGTGETVEVSRESFAFSPDIAAVSRETGANREKKLVFLEMLFGFSFVFLSGSRQSRNFTTEAQRARRQVKDEK